MIRLVTFLFLLIPAFSFSQGQTKDYIDWLSLEKAQEYSKKYNKNMLIYFYRSNCEFCEKMKLETLNDNNIINLINNNFFPVMLNGRTKDTLVFNDRVFGNQQPIKHGSTFRHDLFFDLVKAVNGQYYWPSTVIISKNYETLMSIPGFQPKRNYTKLLKGNK